MKKEQRFRRLNWMRWLLAGLAIVFVRPSVAQDRLVFPVRHHHAWGSCSGMFTLDDQGARYETSHTQDARNWSYDDVQEFQIEASRRLKLLTYEDRKWRFGADRVFEFDWLESEITPEEVYRFLETRVRRPIVALLSPPELGDVRYEFPVKHLEGLSGREGHLLFTNHMVVLQVKDGTDKSEGNRVWRYEDLESISSSGRYELTLTTYERQRFNYASRRVYRFQVKVPLSSVTYDALWRFVSDQKREDRLISP